MKNETKNQTVDTTVDTTVDDNAMVALDMTVAHVNAVETVKSEMADIATVRNEVKTRTKEVKAIAVKLMLWYVANMPLHLELASAIDKGRIKAFAKCEISAKADKDVYGPVRGEFDGLRIRLNHSGVDPRLCITPETTYETFSVDTVLTDAVPTVAGIRKAKREADKEKAVQDALTQQVAGNTPHDVTAEYLALQAQCEQLRGEVERLELVVVERDTEILALKAQIDTLKNTADYSRSIRTKLKEENKALKSAGRAPSMAAAEIMT